VKFGYVSWLPQTELVTRFIEELQNGRLMGTQCTNCAKKYLPPRGHCECGSHDMEWFEASKKGRVLTYTLVTFPPESMTKYAPYIVAIAELDDGSRLLAHITGVTPKTLKVGMRVQVVSLQVTEDRIVYKLKPMG
jgi:uncharacterized OB-fold protein